MDVTLVAHHLCTLFGTVEQFLGQTLGLRTDDSALSRLQASLIYSQLLVERLVVATELGATLHIFPHDGTEVQSRESTIVDIAAKGCYGCGRCGREHHTPAHNRARLNRLTANTLLPVLIAIKVTADNLCYL